MHYSGHLRGKSCACSLIHRQSIHVCSQRDSPASAFSMQYAFHRSIQEALCLDPQTDKITFYQISRPVFFITHFRMSVNGFPQAHDLFGVFRSQFLYPFFFIHIVSEIFPVCQCLLSGHPCCSSKIFLYICPNRMLYRGSPRPLLHSGGVLRKTLSLSHNLL